MIKQNIFKCEKREMLKQVQHDRKKGRHPETRHCHPEFISGSQENKKMLKQVQHDDNPTGQILNPVQYDGYSAGQASNPVQYDGWRRIPSSLGRSMIEMLGALAIIGVLSIGGLYAYRQAMNRYRMTNILDFINRIDFAVAENCTEISTCKFKGDSGAAENRKLLGALVGKDMDDGSDTTYGSFPYAPHTKYFFAINSRWQVDWTICFNGISGNLCTQLAEYKHPHLDGMYTKSGNYQKLNPDGTWPDKQALLNGCKNTSDRNWICIFKSETRN